MSTLAVANEPQSSQLGSTGRRLGWGIVGCGWVASDYVIPALLESANGTLAAVCDLNPAALERWRSHAGLATASLDELLRAPTVEALYIATPNHTHRALVEAAARAGKHVLCEKPMATTSADARAMVDACRDAGVVYATAFDQRMHAAHRELAELVRGGALGTVTQARVHYACWLPPEWCSDNWRIEAQRAGGGAIIDLAPHGLDLLEVLLDDEWAELVAFTQQVVHGYAVDDGAVLAGRFRSGALATLHVAYSCPDCYPRRTLELIGTRARALALNTMGQTPGGRLTLIDAASGEERVVELRDDRSPFVVQAERFADAVLSGKPYLYSPERDLRLFELLERACR